MGSHGRKQYTADFKRDAVALVTQQGYSVAEAAKNLGVNAGLLRRWKTEIERTGTSPFRGKATKRRIRRNSIACGRRTGGSEWNGIF